MHASLWLGRCCSLLATTLVLFLFVGPAALAQQKQHLTVAAPPESTKYLQQQSIDAADVPEHKIRIFEIRKTFAKGAAAFDGVGLVEELDWGYSDYVAGNGHNWGYIQFRLESGDKIYARFEGIAHRKSAADGSASGAGISTVTLTGGSGRFAAIKGAGQASVEFDASKGFNATRIEMDYWFDR